MAMPEEAKHPTTVPTNHHVSKVILREIHQQVGHIVEETICCPSYDEGFRYHLQMQWQGV